MMKSATSCLLLFCAALTSAKVAAAPTTHMGCLDAVAQGHRTLRLESMATAPATAPQSTHPWPFPPLSIGHTSASYQNYSGEPYFHHGLDVRGAAGTPILAAVGGRVTNIENYIPGVSAYWEIAVLDDEGYLWQYHHVEKASIPADVWNSWRNGGRVETGAKLGEIFRWGNSSYGERYDHLHLNVIAAGGTFMSPFLFLENLPDNAAPAIMAAGVLQNGRALDEGGHDEVVGPYSLYATIHDLILHDKYVVPPHRIEIAIDGGASELVWDFQTLPGKTNINIDVEDFFVPAMTCGDYTCRQLTIDLGFVPSGRHGNSPTEQGEKSTLRGFPTTPGQHNAVITAWDFAGNSVSKMIEWTVIKPS